jgi:hypothetical protein
MEFWTVLLNLQIITLIVATKWYTPDEGKALPKHVGLEEYC